MVANMDPRTHLMVLDSRMLGENTLVIEGPSGQGHELPVNEA